MSLARSVARSIARRLDGGKLSGPAWAPSAIRALAPVLASDYTTTGLEWPSADAFAASTARRMRNDADPLILDTAAANVALQDTRGRYLQYAVDRLVPSGDSPATGLSVSGSVLIAAMDGNPQGSHTSAVLTSQGSINALGQTAAFAVTAGDTITAVFLFTWGTSDRLRARFSTGAGNSTVSLQRGSAFAFPDQVNGLISAELVDLGNDIFALICRIVALTTQASCRWMFGPNTTTSGLNVYLHEYNVSRTPHPVGLVSSVATTGADLQTRDITGLGLAALANRFILTGWAPGVTEAVLAQVDDNTDDNRVTLFVDTATLALKARFVVAGVTVDTLPLKTIALGQPFTAAVSWGASDWRGQAHAAAWQRSQAAGTMPALTRLRYARSVAGREASLWLANAYGFARMLTENQVGRLLVAAASSFDPLLSATQALLDTAENIGGVDYIKDSFPGLWPIRRSSFDRQLLRFETRLNYRDEYDQNNDRDYIRSELHSTPNSPIGEAWMAFTTTPINIDGALPVFLEDGVTRRSYTHANLCQLKAAPDPTGIPIFAINLNSDGFRAYVGGGDAIAGADGDDRSDFYFMDIVPRVGRTHLWVAQLIPGVPGTGHVRVWCDGRIIVDAGGIHVAYPETTHMFAKFGLYCHKNVNGLIVDIGYPKFAADLSYLVP